MVRYLRKKFRVQFRCDFCIVFDSQFRFVFAMRTVFRFNLPTRNRFRRGVGQEADFGLHLKHDGGSLRGEALVSLCELVVIVTGNSVTSSPALVNPTQR
jgi:hypothetical protein